MSATQSIPQRRYTVEEYFALEEQSGIRHEFFHCEVFPLDGPEGMAGGTKQHNWLIQNCTFGLRASVSAAARFTPRTCGWRVLQLPRRGGKL